jgi:hypothetical protein
VSFPGYTASGPQGRAADFQPTKLGWEGMLRHGFTIRASSGIAWALGSRRWQCEGEASSCQAPARQLHVQTFALGYAF